MVTIGDPSCYDTHKILFYFHIQSKARHLCQFYDSHEYEYGAFTRKELMWAKQKNEPHYIYIYI